MAYNLLLILIMILASVEVFIKKNEKSRIILLVITCFILWIFFGFRGLVAWDWYNYYNSFVAESYPTFEKGYSYFMYLGTLIFDSYFNFITLSTLIDIAILAFFFYRYSPYPILSFYLMLGFNGFVMEFDLLRHMRAFTLFLISITFVYERKFISYFILNVFGALFHRIALLYIPLYFFFTSKLLKIKKIVVVLVILGSILILLKINIARLVLINFNSIKFYNIGAKITSYFSGIHGNIQISTIGNIEKLLTFILFYINFDKIKKEFKYGELFINIYILFILSYVYFYGFKIISDRLANYTLIISYWVLYPMIVCLYQKYLKVMLFIFLLLITLLKTNLNYVINSKKLYQYKNVLFQKEDMEERKRIRAEEYKKTEEEMRNFINEHTKN